MAIFAIGDLHLSFNNPKPMDIFGTNWEGHEQKVKQDWLKKVKQDDIVIINGDFSWAMDLEEAYLDFKFINELPGKKLLLKGNHDYWWTTLTKMRTYLKDNKFNSIDFLYNNSYLYNNYIITGSRGWSLTEKDTNEKIINREIVRLELSIEDGIQKYGEDKEIIVFMHYPPLISNKVSPQELKFVNLMKKYNVKKCYYAHLHGKSHSDAIEGNIEGIEFKLISGDYIDFKLEEIK